MKIYIVIPNISLLLLGWQSFVANASNASLYFDNDVYSSWYQSTTGKYQNSAFMNTSRNVGVGLFWSINLTSEMIQLAIICPIGSGWCGFGLSESGGMKGTDMIIFESESNELYDAHVLKAVQVLY